MTAIGKDLVRDARYFRLACRICAELGAHYMKTYYVSEGFGTITASCPVPIVMAGGKKLPELEALTMAYRAVQEGAGGGGRRPRRAWHERQEFIAKDDHGWRHARQPDEWVHLDNPAGSGHVRWQRSTGTRSASRARHLGRDFETAWGAGP